MSNDRSKIQAAADRDRRMQVFLAQARGPVRNGERLRESVDWALGILAKRNGNAEGTVMDDALVDSLTCVTAALEQLGIIYAITGSVASSLYGEPHSTVDADLILIANPSNAVQVSAMLSPRFYAPDDVLSDAALRSTMANVVDNRNGLKIDLSFVGDDPFLRQALLRRVRMPIGASQPEFWFVTAEDVILMKLLWRRDTQSAKQWNDALGVVQVRGARMDWTYLIDQAKRLGLTDDLLQLRDKGGV